MNKKLTDPLINFDDLHKDQVSYTKGLILIGIFIIAILIITFLLQ